MSDTDPTETEPNGTSERRSRFGELAAELDRSDADSDADPDEKSGSSDGRPAPVDGEEEDPSGEEGPSTVETDSDGDETDSDGVDSWEWLDGTSDDAENVPTDPATEVETAEPDDRRFRAEGPASDPEADPTASAVVDSDERSKDASDERSKDASDERSEDGLDEGESPDPPTATDEAEETVGAAGVSSEDGEAAPNVGRGGTDDEPDVSRTSASTRKRRIWGDDSTPAVDDESAAASSEPRSTAPATPSIDEPTASDGYRRPDGLDLSPGTSVMIECGTRDDEKEAACHDTLGLESDGPARNVILVRYRRMDPERLEWIAERAHRVELITVGYAQSVPATVEDAIETTNINNPNDITRLGILVSRVIDDLASDDRVTAFGFDSLNILLEYKDVQSTFRFLHVFLGTLTEKSTIAHFHVDPLAGDPQKISTLKPLFDEVVSVDSVGVHLE